MSYSHFTLETVREKFQLETIGTEWLFLKLEGQKIYIDMALYSIERCDKILGILSSMVNQQA